MTQEQKIKHQQLIEFYEEKFSKEACENWKDNYSSPLLISLESDLLTTDIMFVGQETNSFYYGWDEFVKTGVKEHMKKTYDIFMKDHYEGMNRLFWKYIKDLMKEFAISKKVRPVWNNVYKFDLNRAKRNVSHAQKDELKRIQEFHKGILAKEIEIIQPKLIIFFTGPRYDSIFFDKVVKGDGDYRDLYQKIERLDAQGIDEWKCAELGLKNFKGFESFNGKAIRTYHSRYLNTVKYQHEIMDYIKSLKEIL